MGYSPRQVADLAATLEATPAELILAATPIDLGRLLPVTKPVVRVRYDLAETDPQGLRSPIATALAGAPRRRETMGPLDSRVRTAR
jgi:predicted GTPase